MTSGSPLLRLLVFAVPTGLVEARGLLDDILGKLPSRNSRPALVLGPLPVGLFAYLGITHLWGRFCAVLIGGLFGVYLLRGTIAQRVREQYPGARMTSFLAVGQTSLVVGVASKLAFPPGLGTPFDLAWLGTSFFSILLFVPINRKDEHVVR